MINKWMLIGVVERDGEIWSSKPLVKAIGQHRPRAVNRFLRRLTYQHQSPVPPALECRQRLRRPDQAGHVNVVSAGVHDSHVLPRRVLRTHFARVGEAGFFHNRQCVHVAANQQAWSWTIFQNGYDSGRLRPIGVSADVFRDRVPRLA